MANQAIVLHQFIASHFNEKARWGLDWKGLAHRRVTYLPGPHAFFLSRLSGQTHTPVVAFGDTIVAGSGRILDELEQRFPQRPFYPADGESKKAALEIQTRFDRDVGPAVRALVFSVLLDELDYLCTVFARTKSPLVQRLYRLTLPAVRPVIARVNGVEPDNLDRAARQVDEALEFVAKQVAPTGHLAGDTWSVADLSAAALLAPIVSPDHPEMSLPQPMPVSVARLLARYAQHPAVTWVRDQYARHRPESCAID